MSARKDPPRLSVRRVHSNGFTHQALYVDGKLAPGQTNTVLMSAVDSVPQLVVVFNCLEEGGVSDELHLAPEIIT